MVGLLYKHEVCDIDYHFCNHQYVSNLVSNRSRADPGFLKKKGHQFFFYVLFTLKFLMFLLSFFQFFLIFLHHCSIFPHFPLYFPFLPFFPCLIFPICHQKFPSGTFLGGGDSAPCPRLLCHCLKPHDHELNQEFEMFNMV